ncbi:DivIVA domain-containing protein [Labedella gwakjiensis]|uniref:Cell wall synthesis protein Wag31 n=1 Tax=Labedella gwakjiensis TaxID=390269 RepID=A0A2P8GZK1_9MICO|nr:DivIVA domain-containing protein [Labedella gwakjiensis]PSL39382.1 DivIVA domain-containing protein [Labedella gwakjiensis]RUQ86208.1 DivIVA domain-containing protein [Labedella gwakjiensis]
MALTPEDVVNKQFQQTKFREGYDQDEVDDFLDEVVVELRRLIKENEELQERLSSGGSAPAPAAEETSAPEPVAAPVPEPVAAAPVQAAPVADESESSNSLLVLARRLHDEHVREGAEKRDQLIAEGNATAARVVAEAEAKQREELAKLDERRSVLEKEIDELRVFEREYRQQLRSYIESHLRDLDSGTAASTGGIAAAVGDNH